MSLCALAYAASTWKTLANDTHAITIPKLCPTSEELQTNAVKVHFDESKMGGFWYELAMKDITQPRMCSCQTSEKSVSLTDMEIIDDFTIQCYGDVYHSDLRFKLTGVQGVSVGTWNLPVLEKIQFPNTVIDYEENIDGEYDWVIEFQCIQAPAWMGERISFYAFNFYSRKFKNADELIPLMEARARARGLGPFIDDGRDLAIIDHSECQYGH